MNYFFAFLELGGGGVCNMALTASSNLSGLSVSLSLFRCAVFFADRIFTDSLSAPAGQWHSPSDKMCNLSCEPVPSNALLICQPFTGGLFNGDFHALPVVNAPVVPSERELI